MSLFVEPPGHPAKEELKESSSSTSKDSPAKQSGPANNANTSAGSPSAATSNALNDLLLGGFQAGNRSSILGLRFPLGKRNPSKNAQNK